MAKANFLSVSAVTPRQLALIAVLSSALIGVLVMPQGDEPPPAPAPAADANAGMAPNGGAPAAPPVASPVARPAAPVNPVGAVAEARPPASWPEVKLETALKHDPFSSRLLDHVKAGVAKPLAKTKPTRAEDWRKLQDAGFSAVLRDARGPVARVGDRNLRVGDVVLGYRVVAIENKAVVLERVKTE